MLDGINYQVGETVRKLQMVVWAAVRVKYEG